MTRDDRLYLAEIVTARDELASELKQVKREDFLRDIVMQGFVLNRLTIIGEAASKISLVVRECHPEIPWKSTSRMRNIVVHQYFAVDWAIIWDAATIDAPVLREQIAAMISKLT